MAASDPAEELALWRYHLIAETLDPKLTGRERGQMVRRLAGDHHDPGGEIREVSRNTLDRWIRRYRAEGLSGLRDRPRSDTGGVRLDPALLDEAIRLRLEVPARSAAHIAEIVATRHGVRIPALCCSPRGRRQGLGCEQQDSRARRRIWDRNPRSDLLDDSGSLHRPGGATRR
jgi:hypothetical protein